MQPIYDLDKIKFGTGEPTYGRAIGLYENGKVTKFKKDFRGYSAIVQGTHYYQVYVSSRYYDRGSCNCYLGQEETLCKHMVAVAIYAVQDGQELSDKDKELTGSPVCSGELGELNKEKLVKTKKAITSAMRYIKGYTGSSKTWFAYQNSLDEGVSRLSELVSKLPVSKQTAKLLVDTLLRLEKKVCEGGVDDSNGTVGGFMEETVFMLQEYVELNPKCIKTFEKLCGRETCFGWEEPLVKIFDESR